VVAALTRLTVAVVAAVAVACTATTPARAAMTVGVQSWYLPDAETMTTAKGGGLRAHRVVFDWSAIRAGRTKTNWGAYDTVMTAAANARVNVLPVLLGCPKSVCRHRLDPPTSAAQRGAWSGFAASVARRYGRGGSFWAAHPDLDPQPLVDYQIWNEPNLLGYWGGHPSPRAYLRLVALSRKAIHGVDGKATIALAGLAESRHGVPVARYLSALYGVPGARRHFDVAAIHPYDRTGAAAVRRVRRFRAVMNQHGDRRTPIWVTEFGWGTGRGRAPFMVTRRRQASLLGGLLRALRGARRERVGAIYLFCLQDRRLRRGEHDWFGPHAGLFDLAGRPKPAWRTLSAFTGAGPRPVRLRPTPR
jgi:hypothetical protein